MPTATCKENHRLLYTWKVWLHVFLLTAGIHRIDMVVLPAVATTDITANMLASEIKTASRASFTTVKSTLKSPTTIMSSSTFNNRHQLDARISGSTGFTRLEKEVVESLIKQWAPLVWLHPQERFMPLGVEEFLNHVHPAEKSQSISGGMPIGDGSEKTYLVTNAAIDALLDNDNSFLYGRNPSESSVPIYAVASVCSTPASEATPPSTEPAHNINELPYFEQHSPKTSHHTHQAQSTRGPYIPVSLNPVDVLSNTTRRSSRLCPVFKKVQKRDIVSESRVTESVHISPELAFVMGETNTGQVLLSAATTSTTDSIEPSDFSSTHVNNFIANLADNVRFTEVNGDAFDGSISATDKAAEHEKLRAKLAVPSFHVTYWMFYPYSQGKTMCTLSLGPLGRIPFPAVYGFCLGKRKDIGSHIGDWEHMSLFFTGAAEPEAMYVSAHDAGAYYMYNRLTGAFEFKKQETRKGILQRPNFPKTVTTFNNHPVLFAAKGSHGLWTAPGKHRFVKVARLYDVNGFGTPWNTWKEVDITYENLRSHGRSFIPSWLAFKGKWGNPKSKCHPFQGIGLNFCEYTDGPTGIPLKERHFQCDASY